MVFVFDVVLGSALNCNKTDLLLERLIAKLDK